MVYSSLLRMWAYMSLDPPTTFPGCLFGTIMSRGVFVIGYGRYASRFAKGMPPLWYFRAWLMWCNRTNSVRGFPPIIFQDSYGHASFNEDPCSTLPPSVRFLKQLSQLHSEANLAIQRDALSKSIDDRAFVLQSTIDVWLARFDELSTECPSNSGE